MSSGTRPRLGVGRLAPTPGSVVGAVVLGIVAAVAVFPDRLGIDARTPFVQVVAFRPQIAAGLVVVALLVLAGARRSWPVAAALGLVGVVGLAVVAPRATAEAAPAAGDELTVLSVNTYLGQADPDALAALVRSRSPDVVALPEAGATCGASSSRPSTTTTAGPGTARTSPTRRATTAR